VIYVFLRFKAGVDNQNVPPEKRRHKMTVMLSDDEQAFRDAIAKHQGTDASSVMRKGMLDLGRGLGLEFPLSKKTAPAVKPRRGGQ
jgi:hypothetical protein